MTLKDARFALTGDPPSWSLRQAVNSGIWPRLSGAGTGVISVREIIGRFAAVGRELRTLAGGGGDVWQHISRANVVGGVRNRVRNPASFDQHDTALCGPFTILFELARRSPTMYVRAIAELLDRGTFTSQGGRVFSAASDLRARVPGNPNIPHADWLFVATVREEDNLTDDLDDGISDHEGFSWPSEMQNWVANILGLHAGRINCYNTGEMEALRRGRDAVNAGGIAILLIDSDMLKDGGTTHREENVWWRRRTPPNTGWGAKTHAQDDNDVVPSHYIALLGDVVGSDEDGRDDFNMQVWSWAKEYEVTGTAEGVSEYLYWVITGD